MYRFILPAIIMLALLTALPVAAQTTATNTAGTNQAGIKDIEARYEAANETWRINIILFILKDQTARYEATVKIMKDFTAVSRSYVIFKRKGHKTAEAIYYRNLENLSRLEQLKQLLEQYKKDFTAYNKDFLSTYKLDETIFSDFDRFEAEYQKILDRWRSEFEAAMKANKKDEIRRIRQDMQLFQVAITAFILFPGKAANKVGQMQKMENDVRHAVVMLRMYETSTQ